MELITGRRSVDKSRPHREQNLVDWARPMLKDPRKLSRIIDPRLEGQYSEAGAQKAAALAYQCLSHRPKNRPTMSTIVKTLEPLKDFSDIPIGTFVYTVPADNVQKGEEKDQISTEMKKENGPYHHKHKLHHQNHKHRINQTSQSPIIFSETHLQQTMRNGLNSPGHHHRLKRA